MLLLMENKDNLSDAEMKKAQEQLYVKFQERQMEKQKKKHESF